MTDLTTTTAPAWQQASPVTKQHASVDWLFETRANQPLTIAALASIGLPPGPLGGVRLVLARVAQSGTWHLGPASMTACCPRLARAIERGRTVRTASIGLLDGASLCRWCTGRLAIPGLVVPGPEGTCLALAQYLTAAQAWVTALEAQAPSADWLTCSRWTVRTPFTDPGPISELLAALPAGPPWPDYAAATRTAWEHLRERASTAQHKARQAAGPPGYRAMAACARALAAASPGTRAESRLLDASAGLPDTMGAWAIASTAWLRAIATGADPAAASAALATALDTRYRNAQAHDITPLPRPAVTDPEEYECPAGRAPAGHHALHHETARLWSQRLNDCLASVLAQDHDRDWQLLRIAGWPLTSEFDRDLAYLGAYPELARNPHPGRRYPGRRGHQTWIVVLHVPRFAALHAARHDGARLNITAGPPLPSHATPAPAQLRALLDDNPGPCPASPREPKCP